MKRATTAGKSGPTAGERSDHSGKEQSQQQAKKSIANSMQRRRNEQMVTTQGCRRRCPRQCLEVSSVAAHGQDHQNSCPGAVRAAMPHREALTGPAHRVSSTEWPICTIVARGHVPMVQTAQNIFEAPQANHIHRTADVSVMRPRQVSTTQAAQKQRQVPVIQKVLRTTEVPQVQHGARLRRSSRWFHRSGFRIELWSRSQTCQ